MIINNKYIIKEITPWMMDELIVFSKTASMDVIILREQNDFYTEELKRLAKDGVNIYVKPYATGNIFKKTKTILKFFLGNMSKFSLDYNGIIGLKSILWFLKMDMSLFGPESNIHAQFATQPTLISLLIKYYYNNSPKYSFTFHAYDIYFKSKWFSMLTEKSENSYSISNFNINYVKEKYNVNEKVVLSRLGVFREGLSFKEKTNNRNSDPFILGLMTWFDQKKGIIYLMEAMLKLKLKGYENIQLYLAGDGSYREEYLEFIEKNELSKTISYMGKIKREEKQNFFESIDVFVLPSISLKNDQDGIPVVLMEAIAYSLPLISTDVSGIPEICIHDYNGQLIPERNSDALVDSIIYLYENKDKRTEYAKNSFSLSNNYDITLNSQTKMKSLEWV